MAINVSTKTLFNFMQEFEYLKMVLDNKFHPRYYKEDLRPFFKLPVFIAMKCFCDIPLSLVSEHTNTYGKYAIGLSKEWGIEKGLSPITYYNKKSSFIDAIKDGYNTNINLINSKTTENNEDTYNLGKVKNSLQQSFLNYKPIQGRMWRNSDWKRNINFYNEREWRYIPSKFTVKNGKSKNEKWISCKNYYTTDELYIYTDYVDEYNRNIKKELKLKIEKEEIKKFNSRLANKISIESEYSDINFIIVQNNKEILELCKYIDENSKSINEANILKTKIMKYDDIEFNV